MFEQLLKSVVLAGLQYTGLNPISSILKTPGVQNIEHRYSSGGGSKDHLPGAATPRGNPDNVEGNTVKHQGVGSTAFSENISSQKPNVGFFVLGDLAHPCSSDRKNAVQLQ